MACRLVGTKPLTEPMLHIWPSGTLMKYESKSIYLHSEKCIRKCRLQNVVLNVLTYHIWWQLLVRLFNVHICHIWNLARCEMRNIQLVSAGYCCYLPSCCIWEPIHTAQWKIKIHLYWYIVVGTRKTPHSRRHFQIHLIWWTWLYLYYNFN